MDGAAVGEAVVRRVRRRVRVSGLALTVAGLGFAAVVGPEAVFTVGAHESAMPSGYVPPVNVSSRTKLSRPSGKPSSPWRCQRT